MQRDTLSKSITLHQLQVFEAAARHSSFTRAAQELFLTQPTVSTQIKQLTKVVGTPLFEQIGRRLYLTEAGQELFETCKDIFERLARLEIQMAQFRGLEKGHLRLAAATTANYFIPGFLKPFCQRYPSIGVSLEFANHAKVLERMRENLDDLYILSSPVLDGEEIEAISFLSNPLVMVAPASHPLAQQRRIPFAALAEETFILRERGSATREVMLQVLEQQKLSSKIRLELGSNVAIKQAIAASLGLSVLSLHTLNATEMKDQLTVLDVEGFPIQRHWKVIYPKNKQLSITASTFLEYLLTESKRYYPAYSVLPHDNSETLAKFAAAKDLPAIA